MGSSSSSDWRQSSHFCGDATNTCKPSFKPRQQRGVLGSVSDGRTLHGGTDGWRSANALLEFPRLEPAGRLRLVFPDYHTWLLCRQSIGLGGTFGSGRRSLDGGSGLGNPDLNMASVATQTSSPTASRIGKAGLRAPQRFALSRPRGPLRTRPGSLL